jgi:4-methyl-5(b-hydroxyethyl)-thiazole monophosphate biosynthesis
MADGTEEVEALTVIDLLRRAKVNVVTVSVMEKKQVMTSHKIGVEADELYGESDYMDGDMIVLPGGMPGTLNLKKCEKLTDIIKRCEDEEIIISALCAAPSVLGDAGVLRGREYTCYPGFEESIDGIYINIPLVIDDKRGTVITAWGPGAAYRFGFALAEKILGKKTDDLKRSMMMCGDE